MKRKYACYTYKRKTVEDAKRYNHDLIIQNCSGDSWSESRFHMKYHDDDVTTYAIGVEI